MRGQRRVFDADIVLDDEASCRLSASALGAAACRRRSPAHLRLREIHKRENVGVATSDNRQRRIDALIAWQKTRQACAHEMRAI